MKSHSVTRAVFWICLAFIAYVFIGFPVLCLLIALLKGKRHPPEDFFPEVSVIVAARNEEGAIAAKLENLLAQDYPEDKLEIIVVSDASTDGTDAIVEQYGKQGIRLISLPERAGVSQAFHHGTEAASGEILVKADATGTFSSDAIRKLARWFRDPAIGCVFGLDIYETRHANSSSSGWKLYAKYENWLRANEGQVFSPIVISGCIHAVRRSLHQCMPSEITMDLATPLRVQKHGYHVVFDQEAIVEDISDAQLESETTMRIRTASHGLATIWSLREMLVPWKYPAVSLQLFSRKLFRWFEGLLAVPLFITSWKLRGTGRIYRWAFFTQVLFYAAAAAEFFLQKRGRKTVLYIPFYIVMIHLCALIGFVNFLVGHDHATWEPVRK